MNKSYQELMRIQSFEDRFDYLKLHGTVGQETFGFDRYMNQSLYNSPEWKSVRRKVIIRDHGCDLAVKGMEIFGVIVVHHINPLTVEDLFDRSDRILNMDNLISTSPNTHKAIHFGDKSLLATPMVIRTKGDTTPWKKAY